MTLIEMPSKRGVFIFSLAVLMLQATQGLTGREDYPFTSWGMFSTFSDFRNFIKHRVTVEQTSNNVPWRGNPHAFYQRLRVVLKKESSLPKDLDLLVRDHINIESLSGKSLEIRQMFWSELSPHNIQNPDREEIVYQKKF